MNYLILFRNKLLMYVNMVYLSLVSGKLIFVLVFFIYVKHIIWI